MPARILVIDDDLDILKGLKDRLKLLGYSPVTAETGEKALELMNQQLPDMVLLDLALPEMSGLEVLRRIGKILEVGEGGESREGSKRGPCELPVVVLTAHGSIENAVDAMKLGAYDFLTKPFEMDHLALVIEKALEREFLKRQVEQLRTEVDSPYATIIGKSPKIQEVIQITRRAADSEVTALILGETGTGKELFARAIHRWSARHAKPFAVVNCAALPETLLENELFGHEKGAFTGADRLHQGRLESANGGTVFLDEIGDMPLLLQGRLLRVLQDHEVQRVGGTGSIKVDVRFIAATNQNLKQKVEAGTFREDLYYRLNVLAIFLPPLREHLEDVPELARFFLARHAGEAKKPQMWLALEALDALVHYSWPGNIRELENVIARAVILHAGPEITAGQLGVFSTSVGVEEEQKAEPRMPFHEAMESYSRSLILGALRRARGNKTKAAEELQIQRTYLNKMIKQKHIPSEP